MKWPVSICRACETLRAVFTAAALCASMAAAAEVQVEPQPVPEPQPVTSAEAYAEFKRLYEAGDHVAAAVAGRKVVELTEQEESEGSETMQVALMNLGLVQQLSGDFVGAEASYLRVIALLEATGRPSSPRLARAQAGLASAYYSAKRYDLAAAALDRAVVLSRRTEGLFNEDQVPLLAKQADSLTQLGRLDEALQARRYAIRIVGRKYGERSVRYAQELEGLGRWYSVVGAYEGARAILMRALETVERIEGPTSVNLVGPLTALAENAQRWSFDPKARTRPAGEEERRTMFHDSSATPALPGLSPASIAAEGLRWLERAAKIANASPEPSPQVVAAVRTQLGDWYQSRLDSDRALPQYLQAWQASTRAEQGGRLLQEQLFGAPVLLQYPAIDGWDRYAQRPPDEVERRIVELELTVTAHGRVRDIKVIADAGEPRFATRTVQSIEGARYRPRLADGEPVDTTGVRFQQPVFVLRGEEKEEAAPPPVAPAAPAPAPELAPEATPPPQGVG